MLLLLKWKGMRGWLIRWGIPSVAEAAVGGGRGTGKRLESTRRGVER